MGHVRPGERVDLVAEFASPFAALTVAALLGVPEADQGRVRAWAAAITQSPITAAGERACTSGENGLRALRDYLCELAADRWRHAPALMPEGGLHPTGEELFLTCILLLTAGGQFTSNLIGTGTLLLLHHPGQMALLRSRPDLVQSAVEEFLRIAPPVQWITLCASESVEISGMLVREGEPVWVLLGRRIGTQPYSPIRIGSISPARTTPTFPLVGAAASTPLLPLSG